MARKGRRDRGLVQRKDGMGKVVWHVRLYDHGKERQFGSFPTKTKAREFYEQAKLEQKEGRFFPERYPRSGMETLEKIIETYTATLATSGKNPATIVGERQYARWWTDRLRGHHLNKGTAAAIEDAKRELTAQGLSSQTVKHYLKFLRHVLYSIVGRDRLRENPFAKVTMPEGPPDPFTVSVARGRGDPVRGHRSPLCPVGPLRDSHGTPEVGAVQLAVDRGRSGSGDYHLTVSESRTRPVCSTHGRS
jgi:hypothetical protein